VNQEVTLKVKVTATDTRGISASTIRELSVQQSATLVIYTKTEGVMLAVDNEPKGIVDKYLPEKLYVLPGRRILKATKPEYDAWEGSYDLKANDSKEVFIELARSVFDPRNRIRSLKQLLYVLELYTQGDYEGVIAKCAEGLESEPNNADLKELKMNAEKEKAELIKQGRLLIKSNVLKYTVPSVRESVDPIYPYKAKIRRISGKVVFEVSIDENGNVTSLKLLEGHELLQEAAKEAALKWKFYPARLGNDQVKSTTTITINFKL
jgi:TonB family protein